MELLTLQQAARFLDMNPETLRRKAIAGEIPGAKLGNWRFLKEDLVKAIRSQYPNPALRGEEVECSAKSKAAISTTLDFPSVEKEYADLLAPKTRPSRKSTSNTYARSYGRQKNLDRPEEPGRKP